MKKAFFGITFLIFVCGSYVISFGQATPSSRGYALEVTYFKGRPFAYQRVGQWTVYGFWAQVPDWKPKPGELPIEGIRVAPRDEDGILKIKVTILRGKHWEVEDLVGDYRISDDTTIFAELANFGVVPFEVKLVRAPPTVAVLPEIKNDTRSLIVGVEPVAAPLPSFKVSVLNSSDKAVSGFAHRTSVNGRIRSSAMPKDRQGGILIAPGETYSMTMSPPTSLSAESTGEVPAVVGGMQFNILAVMFADGSYEGDATEAARFRAFKIGEKVELTRVLALLRSPSAATHATLAPRVEELAFKVEKSDVRVLLSEFPNLSDAELDSLREIAEVSSSDIQKGIKITFGKGATMSPVVYETALTRTIARCEKWLNSLP